MKNGIRTIIAVLVLLTGVALNPALAATTYVGSWVNTTFGSSGAATIVLDLAGTDLTVIFDLDGPVFGGFDPPALTVTGTFDTTSGGTISASDHPVFGDVSATVSPTGFVSGMATDVPDPFIVSASFMGPVTPAGLIIDYEVFFAGPIFPGGPSSATGFISAAVIPVPAALPLLSSAVLLVVGGLRRHRRTS